MRSLKKILDRFYQDFDFNERLKHDPIEFPRRYSNPDDIEVAGFIASCFAYGRVDLFTGVIEKILAPGGNHPAKFFKSFNVRRDAHVLKGVSYRFNTENDITSLVHMMNRAMNKWGSLRNLFYHYYKDSDDDVKSALSGFTEYFLSIDTSPVYGNKMKPRGLGQLLPLPGKGSACKRMNLFLRWMVRRNDIDLGIWETIPPSKLIIPLDTHIARISRCLGFTKRRVSDWTTAREITESLKKFDPEDPLKYDFALCHHGISGLCKGNKSNETCSSCVFY